MVAGLCLCRCCCVNEDGARDAQSRHDCSCKKRWPDLEEDVTQTAQWLEDNGHAAMADTLRVIWKEAQRLLNQPP